ncbi:MAG: hypothetical protein AB7N76_27150 [Planctomycetota bacterium]
MSPSMPPTTGQLRRFAPGEAQLDLPRLSNELTERVLDSLWLRLERKGLAGLPPRVVRELTEAAGSTAAAPRAGDEAPVDPAGADAEPAGPRRAEHEGQLVEQVTESIWSRLSRKGLGGFPPRIRVELEALASAQAEASLGELRARVEAMATRIEELEDALEHARPSQDRHFLNLAREVKTLRDRVSGLETGAETQGMLPPANA